MKETSVDMNKGGGNKSNSGRAAHYDSAAKAAAGRISSKQASQVYGGKDMSRTRSEPKGNTRDSK